MENFHVNVNPEKVLIPFLNIEVSETLLTLWVTTLLIFVFCLFFRFVLIKRFKEVPGKFQNVLELCVETIRKYTQGNLGRKAAGMAAYSFTIIVTLVFSSLFELFGMRGPATDFNFALAIALMSFVLIVGYGIKYKGAYGYIKSFGQPKGFMWPFRFLSELVIPISLSCRLFGNLFAALVVMELIYAVMAQFAVVVPAVLSIYFNLFDVGIQTYIFVTLTQVFINEAVEESDAEKDKKRMKKEKKEQKRLNRTPAA